MITAKVKRNFLTRGMKKSSGGDPSFVGNFYVDLFHGGLLRSNTNLGAMISYNNFYYYLNVSFLQP